jgi:hypothetical protein
MFSVVEQNGTEHHCIPYPKEKDKRERSNKEASAFSLQKID